MNRFLQKLLLFSTFLLLLGGWYRLNMALPVENGPHNEQPSFEQSSIHSSACLLPIPFQFSNGTLGAQTHNDEAGKLIATLYDLHRVGHFLKMSSFAAGEETAAGIHSLYLLYRKLRL